MCIHVNASLYSSILCVCTYNMHICITKVYVCMYVKMCILLCDIALHFSQQGVATVLPPPSLRGKPFKKRTRMCVCYVVVAAYTTVVFVMLEGYRPKD